MAEYKYSTFDEDGRKYIMVERLGRFEMSEGENAEDKAKNLAVSLRNENPDDVKVKKVDDRDLGDGVVTSDQPTKKK